MEDESRESRAEKLADSLESPDESLNSDIFVVKVQTATEESVSSSRIVEFLEQVDQEDSGSYFVTLPGPLRRINSSPLNDLVKGTKCP